MKDGFRRFEIEPLEDTLEFMGPAQSSETVKLLEGNVKLSLTRPTKIRSMSVKFKGFARVNIKGKYTNIVVLTPMLPKLKCPIGGKTLLPAGDHVIPWDIEIPNIYPPSLLIKRATIFYRVEVVISFALAKSITAEHPITLRRHLLPCMELAPLVETKLYERTVPAKFHYEIEAPQIICLDQLLLPFAVKYLCIANQKAVQSIRTQLTQIELYRIQSVSKTDANLTQVPMDIYNLEKKMLECKERRDYAKFVKRTIPALIHSVDQTRSSAWKQPIVLRHKLHQFLHSTYDSPLVSIHHQLEITFQFDHRFEDIKAKIPIIIASIPSSAKPSASTQSAKASSSQQLTQHPFLSSVSSSDSKYPFETITRFESLSVVPEQNDRSVPRASEDSNSHRGIQSVVVDPAISGPLNSSLSPQHIRHQPQKQQQQSQQQGHLQRLALQQKSSNTSTNDQPIWESALPLPPPGSTMKNTTKANASILDIGRASEDVNAYRYHQQSMAYNKNNNYNNTDLSSVYPNQQKKTVKRHNSAQDLNDYTLSLPMLPEERPRTTTPMQRRRNDLNGINNHRRRRPLPPIDVELANGIKPKSLPRLADPSTQKTNSSSEVLPEADRSILHSLSNQDIVLASNKDNDSSEDNEFDFQSVYSDLSLASPEAPSLSSSATEASNGSHHTLLTRPPSPAYRPAPGLPANTALRSHEEQSSALVEESFSYNTITSPAIATVASSVLLSPCSSNASITTTSSTARRRIALSSVSSIMNGSDALSFRSFGGPFNQQNRSSNGSSIVPPIPSSASTTSNTKHSFPSALRDSSVLEPEDHDVLSVKVDNSNDDQQPTVDAKHHYLHAKLPPIPTTATATASRSTSPQPPPGTVIPRTKKATTNDDSSVTTEYKALNETKRMTRLYVDDSDDETLDPLPPIPEKQAWKRESKTVVNDNLIPSSTSSSPSTSKSSSSLHQWATSLLNNATAPPPQLPRLSFGMALGDALGLDQFKRK
ncbi:uncharacterized protein BX664DRAFT_360696 [Halteromyces radiatus]|uniref:uncharacterized protein n=1 Tax=Halteromyces radiatus TaxID=101107 RepID=UPI00221E3DD6|nr:uncharacterized protein BX664DRAFT_360696 [Halteromyces radiatus]KAI8084878.1 hypothetical protein BX664DRAFT_360696 [Halteromyces radiatus]